MSVFISIDSEERNIYLAKKNREALIRCEKAEARIHRRRRLLIECFEELIETERTLLATST